MVGRVKKSFTSLIALALIGGAAFLVITRPQPYSDGEFVVAGEPDIKNGEMVFWAGGCVSCHAAPGAEGDAQLTLSGGLALKSPFGTFYPPNISPDPDAGIGSWSVIEFASAMKRGVGRKGEHLYPSLPYTSYARMSDADIRDLFAYIGSLPKSSNVTPNHDLPFPFNIRLALGGWKFLYFNDKERVALDTTDDKVRRGQYLVEGAGHCGECHTPRDFLGGLKATEWLAGALNPEGEGFVPDITPGGKDVGGWSSEDIAYYLESGFTPDFDSAGGSMAEVQRNIAHLTAEDREAIAAYLKAIPAR